MSLNCFRADVFAAMKRLFLSHRCINVASSIFTIGVDRKIIKDTTIKGNIKHFHAGIPALAAMQQSEKPIFNRK